MPRTWVVMAAGAFALAGCSGPAPLSINHAWVRLAANPHAPAAAYFVIHGGPAPATLIDVTSDVAVRAEMHQSMTRGTMATMQPLKQVAIPARTAVTFAPGGRHVMLFDMNPGIKPGRRISLTATFADGTRIQLLAGTIGPADPAPDS